MEEKLFLWTGGWDQMVTMCFWYYKVTTRVRIGDIPEGTKFSSACIDYDEGTLEFWEDDEEEVAHAFSISLSIEGPL